MGGHGGLNILPQKRWNVYRQDNREKVANDEKLLREARDKQKKTEHIKNLHDKVNMLRSGNVSDYRNYEEIKKEERNEEEGMQSDNELYKKTQKEVKNRDRGNKKQIQGEMLKSVGDQQHVNLFRQEQINEVIKQKTLEQTGEIEGKEDYLKKSGKLGEILKERQRPWYVKSVLPEQLEQNQSSSKHQKDTTYEQFLVKQQIRTFKQGQDDFCKVIDIPTQNIPPQIPITEASPAKNNSKQNESESESDEKRHKKHKHHKKDKKKEKKKEKKRLEKEKLKKLRDERLQREEQEKRRVDQLLRHKGIQ